MKNIEARLTTSLGEQRRVRAHLQELDVVRDREDLIRVSALVRDDNRLSVGITGDED